MTTTTTHGAMPELPEPEVSSGSYAGPVGEGASENLYTADQMRDYARAAIEQAVAVPEGHRIVPVEPTPEMLNAVEEKVGGHCYVCTTWDASEDDCRRVYAAMLAAAPPLPSRDSVNLAACGRDVEIQPLTELQISDLMPINSSMSRTDTLRWMARAVERAHGITEPARGNDAPTSQIKEPASASLKESDQ